MLLLTSHTFSVASGYVNSSSDTDVTLGLVLYGIIAFGWISGVVMVKKSLWNSNTGEFTVQAKNWFKNLFLVSFMAFLPVLSGCLTAVDAGHVGIRVNMAGTNRGVDAFPTVTGWTFYNPITEKIIQYPTFIQTAVWSASNNEGNRVNEEISFNSKKGLIITSDISLSFRIEPEKVPSFYKTFRKDDVSEFTHGYLRNMARDAFQELGAKFETEDIYGARKDELLKNVQAYINEKVRPFGVVIEQFGFLGAPRLPESVVAALNASQAAVQKAIQVENEIRQTEAEAKKRVAVEMGQAAAQTIHAKAQAESNLLLSKSLTPEFLKYKQLQIMEKWDGRRPLVEGQSSGFIFNLPLQEVMQNEQKR